MPAPKSVVKLSKNGVEYTSNVEAANYYIFELTRAALRDASKYVRKEFRKQLYDTFEKHTGKAGKALVSEILSSRSTKFPRVNIGVPQANSKHAVEGFWNFWLEQGTKNMSGGHTLKNTVMNNVQTIIEIESQYLSGLNKDVPTVDIDDSEDLVEEGEE